MPYDRASVLRSFEPWRGRAEPDSYRDFLGVRTRVAYLPPVYQQFAGAVEGSPETVGRATLLADPVELAGVLQAVNEASGSFACVELGAGFGTFVIAAGAAARRRGIARISLIAVEGSSAHIGFMRQHFVDNGFDPRAHELWHAVVGAYDGTAQFPKLHEPSIEWGGEAIFVDGGDAAGRTPQLTTDNFETVPCLSLTTILRGLTFVDVVHFDIQGSEFDVVAQGREVLKAKARRVVIGTHGRDIEQNLLRHFDREGWTLEDDKACSFLQPEHHPITLMQDGVQVWRNKSL